MRVDHFSMVVCMCHSSWVVMFLCHPSHVWLCMEISFEWCVCFWCIESFRKWVVCDSSLCILSGAPPIVAYGGVWLLVLKNSPLWCVQMAVRMEENSL